MNIIENTNNKITVVDALMGSGKTEWSIQHINSNQFDNFLYITPFLTEVDRILKGTEKTFMQPINKGDGKLVSINELLSNQCNIAATHELFKHLDDESKANIKAGHYTLILDEVLNVVAPYERKHRTKDNDNKDNIKVLQDSGCVTIDEEGFVIWSKDKLDYNTDYNDIKLLTLNKSLLYINQKLLLWRYPPEIFELFDKVYILTYMFEASILKSYFDLYNIRYEVKSLKRQGEKNVLVDYFVPDTSVFIDKINIQQGKLNENIRQRMNGLSVTWFNSRLNKENILQLERNVKNYFGNILNAKAETIMWTTFKNYKTKLKGKGYTNQFVSCNCRSTNDYEDCYNLAYCVNIYLHPAVSQFFKQKNIEINEDLYALSEMIQWIWRSRIRKGGDINIYVPSIRMRNLLNSWMRMSLDYQNKKAS